MKTLLLRAWKAFYAGWMRFAHVLGIVNTAVLLTLIYIILILPLRFIWLLLRKDPLFRSSYTRTPGWQPREPEASDLDERSHPF